MTITTIILTCFQVLSQMWTIFTRYSGTTLSYTLSVLFKCGDYNTKQLLFNDLCIASLLSGIYYYLTLVRIFCYENILRIKQLSNIYMVVYWLIRRTVRIRIPIQASKRNMKKIFLQRFPLTRFLAKILESK